MNGLNIWKRNKQVPENVHNCKNILNIIQFCCENLVDLIYSYRQHCDSLIILGNKLDVNSCQTIGNINSQLLTLLNELIKSTFVVDVEPPQVMKTKSKFTAVVRSLIRSVAQNPLKPIRSSVSIVSEEQVNSLNASQNITLQILDRSNIPSPQTSTL